MIKYLIVDDEYIAHNIIKEYCDMLPDMELQGNCYDAIEAIQFLNKQSVDLIFLDLNMPKLKGFDFLKTLASPPKIIVTTAYSEYAIEGYELNIVDYLLKPFGFDRFLKAMNKVTSTPKENVVLSSEARPMTKGVDRVFLKGDKKYVQVKVDDILYVEAAGNYTKVISQEETVITREKISNLINSLPSEEFLQVHKSFAVAIKSIKSIEGNRIRIGEAVIPIGKVYKMNVNKLLGS